MELRRTGAAGRGGDAQPRPSGVSRRRRAGPKQYPGVTVAAVVLLRSLTPADRSAVEAMTRDTGFFHDDEVAIAVEVFDAAVAGTSDYVALGAEVNGALAGWICWGPTPCTLGTWDCYWIVVDPAHQGE